jgi:hypothetical protein
MNITQGRSGVGRVVIAAILLTVASPLPALAATRTWTGAGGDGLWGNAANWQENVAPVDGDDLVFPAGGSVTVTNNLPNLRVRSLSISATRTITGAAIQIEKGITLMAESWPPKTVVLLDLPMRVLEEQLWTVPANGSLTTSANGTIELVSAQLKFSMGISIAAIVDLQGKISGSGGLTTLNGNGTTMALRGDNTFQGRCDFASSTTIELHHPARAWRQRRDRDERHVRQGDDLRTRRHAAA